MRTPGWSIARYGNLARFLRSASGGVAMSFAAASPALLAIASLAIDYSSHSMKVIELQAAADASALGGAKEMALAGSSDDTINSVTAAYVATEFDGLDSVVTSNTEINRKAGTLRVELEELWTPVFAQFLNADITPIRVGATASLVGNTNICVLTLDGSGSRAIHMDKRAELKANNCGVYSNSTHAEGIRLDLDSSMHASLICSSGGYKAKTSAVDPKPTTDCPIVPDPLADRKAPGTAGCDKTNFTIFSGTKTLDPGTYCGGLKIGGTAAVTFKSGTYVVKNGKFTVSDDAKITGEHVGFYLFGNASVINFTDDASVTLTGSKDGDMAGLLFFEDRAAPINRKHHIQSTKVDVLTGTIYLSRGQLLIDPNSEVAQDSAYTAIIAHRLELTEGPELVLNSDYGETDVPVPAGIVSTSQVVLSE